MSDNKKQQSNGSKPQKINESNRGSGDMANNGRPSKSNVIMDTLKPPPNNKRPNDNGNSGK